MDVSPVIRMWPRLLRRRRIMSRLFAKNRGLGPSRDFPARRVEPVCLTFFFIFPYFFPPESLGRDRYLG